MKIGFVASAFDLLHAGHTLMLEEAKTVCDYLIVGLQTDPTIERPEKLKPILSYEERENILRSLRFISNVVKYTTEEDLTNILKTGKYSVRILGDDYKNKYATGQEYSEHIVYIDRSHGWSTTKYKKLIAASLIGENK